MGHLPPLKINKTKHFQEFFKKSSLEHYTNRQVIVPQGTKQVVGALRKRLQNRRHTWDTIQKRLSGRDGDEKISSPILTENTEHRRKGLFWPERVRNEV